MRSEASSVAEYLKELPADRRAAIEAVRGVILENLDGDYEEGMGYGMIAYYVPHRVFPAGYHCDPKQPLMFAALASQKNYMAVYLMSIYGSANERAWFEGAWKKSGKSLDAGKSCIRFKRVEDVPLEVIGEAVRRVSVKRYVEAYVKALAERGEGAAPTTKRTGKAPGLKKKSAPKKEAAPKKKVSKKAGAKKKVVKKKAGKKKVGKKKAGPQ